MNSTILVSESDAVQLRKLLNLPPSAKGAAEAENFRHLQGEFARARVVPDHELPEDVVTLGSAVTLRDVSSGEISAYTVVMPWDADASEGRLSILAPLGTALLGFRAGDEIEWPVPSGMIRFRIENVRPPLPC